MDSIIYYFSGTGNSLKVAKDISERLGNTKLIRISKSLTSQNTTHYKRVGIIFPVYYYGMPAMVKEFVKTLKLEPDTYVYAVATCGGSVGISIKQLNDLLSKNGSRLSSAFSIAMPDNYQVMFSPPSGEKQNKLFKLETEKIGYIINVIKENKVFPFEEKNSVGAKLLRALLAKSFSPKDKDKNFWVDDKCDGCGICSKVCPSNNISINDRKPQWLNQCEQCLACLQWCPKHSLQYKKGTVKRERYTHPEIKLNELLIKQEDK